MRTFVIPLCVGICAMVLAGRADETAPGTEATYYQDVAPILEKHCVSCHRPNDIAPMSLVTYDEVLPFARMIRENVVQRKMPPWHADPAFGEFTNDARLKETDIATIVAWVKGGAKRGETMEKLATETAPGGWHIKPDMVLTTPEFHVPRTMQDDYEYVYVP